MNGVLSAAHTEMEATCTLALGTCPWIALVVRHALRIEKCRNAAASSLPNVPGTRHDNLWKSVRLEQRNRSRSSLYTSNIDERDCGLSGRRPSSHAARSL